MELIDAPRIIDFGIRLGKDSVDKLLKVLEEKDWKKILAYIDEDSASNLIFAFAELEIHKNIEYIASDETEPEYILIDFFKAFAMSSKQLRFVVPKFEISVERG